MLPDPDDDGAAQPMRARRATRVAAPLRAALCGLATVLAFAFAGCGGGAGASLAPTPLDQPAGPGRLLAATPLAPVAAAQIAAALGAIGGVRGVVPRYDVATWRLEYLTTDADGLEVRASALLAVPLKGPSARSPLLSWQHGTIFRDADAPSNAIAPDAAPIVLAATGYLVVAADYVGYGASCGRSHPYLLAAPSAAAVVDLLTAARTWRLRHGVAGNGQLFLAGYSEGGYTTMAAHRALESGDSAHRAEIVAAVPGAGPYHVAATLDALLDRVRDESPFLAAFIDPGFLRHMPGAIRVETRRALVRLLVPADADTTFDMRFVDAYFEDDRDRIERQSNVHDWKPAASVRLFHGRGDLTVPYVAASSTLAAMRTRGAADIALSDCGAVPADHLPCVVPYFEFLAHALGEHARDL